MLQPAQVKGNKRVQLRDFSESTALNESDGKGMVNRVVLEGGKWADAEKDVRIEIKNPSR